MKNGLSKPKKCRKVKIMGNKKKETNPIYEIIYYYEYVDHVLYAGNKKTYEKFGAEIDPNILPISEDLKKKLKRLCYLWQLPGFRQNKRMTPLENKELKEGTEEAIMRLNKELGDEYIVYNDVYNHSDPPWKYE